MGYGRWKGLDWLTAKYTDGKEDLRSGPDAVRKTLIGRPAERRRSARRSRKLQIRKDILAFANYRELGNGQMSYNASAYVRTARLAAIPPMFRAIPACNLPITNAISTLRK
jgi:hypothetical protein